MKTHTDVQIIKQDGLPAFAVIPYGQYLELIGRDTDGEVYIPHEVVGLCVEKGMSLIAAWRTYKGMSQAELADKMGITQPGVAQIEKEGAKPQLRTLEKAAQALGVQIEQLTD